MNRMATLLIGCMLAATSIWAQAPNISYPQSSYSFAIGTAISQLTPTNTGGPVAVPGSIGVVTTLAGSGCTQIINIVLYGCYADGTGTAASFNNPFGVAVDGGGNIYVADCFNHRIRKISPAGVVTTLAGSGNYAYADGTGTAASFSGPSGVALDGSGNVYVADQWNHRIRKISPAGVVTTLAGSGNTGDDDGKGTAASFRYPSGLAVDGSGNVYVADNGNNRIRKISPWGGVTTLAGSYPGYANGTGTAALFQFPTGVAVDGNGNVYVADYGNHCIRKISPAGLVTTLAGGGGAGFFGNGYADGTGTAAGFDQPSGVAVDGSGNVYVADADNNRIRKISPAGVVTTLAGSGNQAYADGTGTAASFSYPRGVAVDGSGNLYVADYGNNRIRKISQTAGGYTVSPTLPAGLTLNATTGVISGTPTVATPATSYVVTATNASGNSNFSISISTKLVVGPTINSLSPTNTYCAGGSIAIAFSALGFDSANVFTAQLSNSTGSFTSPVTIGTLNGANGGTINATLSTGQAAGTGYRIRILAGSPAITGANNGTNLTINARPSSAQAAVTPTSSQTICAGASVVFRVPKTAGFTYQWRLGGNAIAGATDTSYAATAAGTYAVNVTNAAGCSRVSSNRSVIVKPLPATTFTITNVSGGNKKLYATQSAGQYQWYLNGNLINGATSRAYIATVSGSYHLVVTRLGCTETGAAVPVTVGSVIRETAAQIDPFGDDGDALLVYPNPSAGSGTIDIQSPAQKQWRIAVTDITGRIVEEVVINSNEPTMFGEHLVPGLYTIQATSASGRMVKQWVKQ